MNLTVFYAWQDDRPGKYTRYLIRDAAKEACVRITDDASNEYVVSLDEATLGVPGMCDIPNTILEKIQACDVFVGDLTFVGRTDAENEDELQLISNPNVLFELGYAVQAKGFERILGVMNVAYGEPERQMFDVKRRWAIRYNLPENSDKSEVRAAQKDLSTKIEDALLTILDKAVLPKQTEEASERLERIPTEFESSVRKGAFHAISAESPAIAVTLVPDAVEAFDHAKLQSLPPPLPDGIASSAEPRGRSMVWAFDSESRDHPNGPTVRCSIVEITVEGIALAADTFGLDLTHLGKVISQHFDRAFVESVFACGGALQRLGASLPWRLGVSLLRMRGYRIYAGPPERGRRIDDKDDLIADPIVVRDLEHLSNLQNVAALLEGAFDYFWREFGIWRSRN